MVAENITGKFLRFFFTQAIFSRVTKSNRVDHGWSSRHESDVRGLLQISGMPHRDRISTRHCTNDIFVF